MNTDEKDTNTFPLFHAITIAMHNLLTHILIIMRKHHITIHVTIKTVLVFTDISKLHTQDKLRNCL